MPEDRNQFYKRHAHTYFVAQRWFCSKNWKCMKDMRTSNKKQYVSYIKPEPSRSSYREWFLIRLKRRNPFFLLKEEMFLTVNISRHCTQGRRNFIKILLFYFNKFINNHTRYSIMESKHSTPSNNGGN